MTKRVGDLTDMRFEKLVVLSLAGKDKYYDKIWTCRCDCGNIVDVRQGHLRSGHTKSCGCDKFQLKDFTDMRFDSLVVIERVEDYVCPGNGKRYVRYKCRCDCGKIVIVNALNLKNGTTKSCGCQNPHAFSDLSGRRFGKLLVKHRVSDYVNPSGRKLVRYLCECQCGKQVFELANTLRNGDVESCECVLRSRGEDYVRSVLASEGITYELHKTFPGCVSPDGNKLSFDFYLPDKNALIECNGIQHYEAVEFFGGEDRLLRQQEHDALKERFAMSNGYSYLVLDCRGIAKIRLNFEVMASNLSKFIDSIR